MTAHARCTSGRRRKRLEYEARVSCDEPTCPATGPGARLTGLGQHMDIRRMATDAAERRAAAAGFVRVDLERRRLHYCPDHRREVQPC